MGLEEGFSAWLLSGRHASTGIPLEKRASSTSYLFYAALVTQSSWLWLMLCLMETEKGNRNFQPIWPSEPEDLAIALFEQPPAKCSATPLKLVADILGLKKPWRNRNHIETKGLKIKQQKRLLNIRRLPNSFCKALPQLSCRNTEESLAILKKEFEMFMNVIERDWI